MRISTSARAGKQEVEVSLLPEEAEALFGPSLHEEHRVKVVGNARDGLSFVPTDETHQRRTRLVKPLEVSRRQPFASRFWIECSSIGVRREKLGQLMLTPVIEPGKYVRTPPIVKSWHDQTSLDRILDKGPLTAPLVEIAKQNVPEPSPPPEPTPAVERSGINGVPVVTDPHIIGGSKNNFGRLLGLVRLVNQTMKLCGEANVNCWLVLKDGKLVVQREYGE